MPGERAFTRTTLQEFYLEFYQKSPTGEAPSAIDSPFINQLSALAPVQHMAEHIPGPSQPGDTPNALQLGP